MSYVMITILKLSHIKFRHNDHKVGSYFDEKTEKWKLIKIRGKTEADKRNVPPTIASSV